MLKTTLIVILLLSTFQASAESLPKNQEQKTLYAIGLTVSQQLAVFNLTSDELSIVVQAILDSGNGRKPEIELKDYAEKVQELARIRRKIQGEKLASANKDFLEKALKEKGAIKTESGLVYLSLKEGTGPSPKSPDVVKVNYRGTLADGKEFDSTYRRGKPLEIKLDRGIKCWSEGLQKMRSGAKARLVCPSDLAYGDSGVSDIILPGATIAFEVELLEVLSKVKQEIKSDDRDKK